MYCPLDASSPLPCPAGSFCSLGVSNRPPVLCPPGSWCPSSSSAPTPCPASSFCADASSAPTRCPIGFFCPKNSTAPLKCTVGTSCWQEGMSEAYVCPAGSYCPDPVFPPAPCPAGFFCRTVQQKQPCPKGSYCPLGSTVSIGCTPGNQTCADVGLAAPVACPDHCQCPDTTQPPQQCTTGHGAAAEESSSPGVFASSTGAVSNDPNSESTLDQAHGMGGAHATAHVRYAAAVCVCAWVLLWVL
jgi:hypothetical protein